uniref:Uncharacterized protein n=1 Tax=Tanacetum cinerariifolium TaxID=118510 RepID=A0A6L2NR95_TANCI|nr:hypothetical protein [Tanacetum cinerariifolium]
MKVVVLRREQEAAGGGGCCGVTSSSGVDGGGGVRWCRRRGSGGWQQGGSGGEVAAMTKPKEDLIVILASDTSISEGGNGGVGVGNGVSGGGGNGCSDGGGNGVVYWFFVIEVFCVSLGVFFLCFLFLTYYSPACPSDPSVMSLDNSNDYVIPDDIPVDPSLEEAGHVPISKDPKGEALTIAEFLRLPNLHGCKIVVGALLSPGASLKTRLSTPATRLEDIPPKTRAMETTEVACKKVIAGREKKKRKTEATTVAMAKGDDDVDSGKVASKKCADEVGTSCKKRKTHVGTPPVDVGSDQVSSPIPLNQSFPVTLMNKKNVFETPSAARNGDANVVIKGHGDTVEGYSAGGFRNLPFTPQWELTDSSRMALTKEHADLVQAHESCENAKTRYKECKQELAKIQSAYDENVSAYDQLSKNYDGALTREKSFQDRLEEMEKEKKETEQLSIEQTERIKQLKPALKQSEDDAHQLRLDRESTSLRLVMGKCLAVGKGFIDGLSVGRKDEDV